jgi:hypothetical protein
MRNYKQTQGVLVLVTLIGLVGFTLLGGLWGALAVVFGWLLGALTISAYRMDEATGRVVRRE